MHRRFAAVVKGQILFFVQPIRYIFETDYPEYETCYCTFQEYFMAWVLLSFGDVTQCPGGKTLSIGWQRSDLLHYKPSCFYAHHHQPLFGSTDGLLPFATKIK